MFLRGTLGVSRQAGVQGGSVRAKARAEGAGIQNELRRSAEPTPRCAPPLPPHAPPARRDAQQRSPRDQAPSLSRAFFVARQEDSVATQKVSNRVPANSRRRGICQHPRCAALAAAAVLRARQAVESRAPVRITLATSDLYNQRQAYYMMQRFRTRRATSQRGGQGQVVTPHRWSPDADAGVARLGQRGWCRLGGQNREGKRHTASVAREHSCAARKAGPSPAGACTARRAAQVQEVRRCGGAADVRASRCVVALTNPSMANSRPPHRRRTVPASTHKHAPCASALVAGSGQPLGARRSLLLGSGGSSLAAAGSGTGGAHAHKRSITALVLN